jgi:antitoxin component of MazEF toxin-antitoxin module
MYIRKGRAMKAKISKWGNSLGLRLPKAAVEAAGLAEGSELDVVVEGRELRLRRLVPFRRYRLEDLIAEMDRLGPENPRRSTGGRTAAPRSSMTPIRVARSRLRTF